MAGANGTLFPFTGTSADAVSEQFFDRPTIAGGRIVRRPCAEITIKNTHGTNSLDVSFDVGATFHTIAFGVERRFVGPIINGRGAWMYKSTVGAAAATFEGYATVMN